MDVSLASRTGPAPAPARQASGPRPAAAAPWGWLEIIAVVPTVFPALLFIPALVPLRIVTRVGSFALPLIALGVMLLSGRRAVGRTFPPIYPMLFAAGWLVLSIVHPTTNAFLSGIAQAALVVSIMSPVFWVPRVDISAYRLKRLIALLLACNAASTLIGVAQFYNPDRFNPPEIGLTKILRAGDVEAYMDSMMFTTADGRKILRPCGLTDSPGGAAQGGMLTCLIGLVWALRPMSWWRRAILLGLAFAGMGVLYLSQVRVLLLTLIGSLLALVGLLLIRRDFRKASMLGLGLALVMTAAVAWVAKVGGDEALRRYWDLLEEDPTKIYYKNRGGFVQETFDRHIWDYPLGAGLGRWGMMYQYFGDKSQPFGVGRGQVWCEVQITAWIMDGGIPLLLAYTAGILLALFAILRIALRSPDPDISFWAGLIFAMILNVVVVAFGGLPFIAPIGIQFWLLAAAVYAAGERARVAWRGRAAPR